MQAARLQEILVILIELASREQMTRSQKAGGYVTPLTTHMHSEVFLNNCTGTVKPYCTDSEGCLRNLYFYKDGG